VFERVPWLVTTLRGKRGVLAIVSTLLAVGSGSFRLVTCG